MLAIDLVRLSTRMFRTNRSRTLLTILGISVGIAAILFLVSLGYGLQRLILSQITNSEALLSLDVTTPDPAIKMGEVTVSEISSLAGVKQVVPLLSVSAQLRHEGVSTEVSANFASADFFALDGTDLLSGRFLDPDDNQSMLITASALNLFGLKADNAIGRRLGVSIYRTPKNDERLAKEAVPLAGEYEIVGIINEDASNVVYLPFPLAAANGLFDYSRLKVRVEADSYLDPVRSLLIDKGYNVSALSDVIDQANQVFRIVQIVLGSFGIVALIVSAIGMFNTMTIALLERTQEIGIMKALGATSFDIWRLFLSESALIGFFGGAGGILLGLAGGEIFNYGINLLASAFDGDKIDLFYTPLWFVLLIISFSSVVGLATGFYPARRAARLNCLEALRYK